MNRAPGTPIKSETTSSKSCFSADRIRGSEHYHHTHSGNDIPDDDDDEDAYLSMEDEDQQISDDFTHQHRLQYRYCLWISQREKLHSVNRSNFSQNLMPITTFETVEQFWSVYSYILPSQKLPNLTDLHLFKEGISPLWEHESNKKGCHLKIFVRKQITQRLWENLVLAFLGEQFMLSEEICGIVLNIRKTDTISIWLKTTDPKIVNNIGMTFFRTLNLPIDTFVRCNLHQEKSEDVEGSSKLNIISLGVSGIKVEIETSSDDWKKITNFEQLE